MFYGYFHACSFQVNWKALRKLKTQNSLSDICENLQCRHFLTELMSREHNLKMRLFTCDDTHALKPIKRVM